MAKVVKFIVSIDTEEDNWGNYSCKSPSLENIQKFPEFHKTARGLGIKPTYLITYPVAVDEFSREVFLPAVQAGECEIGAHCHPWNTPPIEEETTTRNSMLSNLPGNLQKAKLEHLTSVISRNFSLQPRSFRAGRWGFSEEISLILSSLGYTVDTSIIPLQDWSHLSGANFSNIRPKPYWHSTSEILRCKTQPENVFPLRPSNLVEIPVSVGFLEKKHARAERLYRIAAQPRFKKYHSIGILEKLSLSTKVSLLPEIYSLASMIELSERLIDRGVPCLNFAFHSCALTEGLTPFHKTKDDVANFEKKIYGFFEYIQKNGYQSVTLQEAAADIAAEIPSEKQASSSNHGEKDSSAKFKDGRSEQTLNRLEPVSTLRNVA